MSFELPTKGFVFWPVGTGDSTTIVVDKDEAVMQVDLHHLSSANDEDDPHAAIVDELEEHLPKNEDGEPYLAVFALTHPDTDHIKGFEELLNRIEIGEIWHTPRIFREYHEDLGDDASAFKREVKRRREKTIENDGDVESGDRVRVIGHDDIFDEDKYRDFPDRWRTYPSDVVSELDGADYSDSFEAFIHAPFKDDSAGERNETSLAMQVALFDGEEAGKALLLSDLSYPSVKRIFDKTKEKDRPERLEWDVLLAPHHCSKSVMYWKGEDDDEERLKQDMLDDFEEASLPPAYVVTSAESEFSDGDGDNPPHQKARNRYEEIVDEFICTQEHPNEDNPEPVSFEFTGDGFDYTDPEGETAESETSNLSAAVQAARGTDAPPKEEVGFGRLSCCSLCRCDRPNETHRTDD